MPASAPAPLAFDTFGDLLKYLRRRTQLTQKELSIAVGYSEGQISRLEQNQRLPDLATIAALFVPALDADPPTAARLMELAARARGESVTLTRTVTREITETVEADAPAHHLPLQLTHFIGREREVEAVVRLLSPSPIEAVRNAGGVGEGVRLVTLTGAGGAGKTRLALEAAARLEADQQASAVFIEMAPLREAALTEPGHIAQAAASALRLKPSGDPLDGLLRYLRARRMLLVLDNCEHVIEAAAQFAEAVLRACPLVQILATSREALQITGETAYRVPPLIAPDAAQLFLARAREARPQLALTAEAESTVAQICQRLDGLPLAIELAAARVNVMSLGEIAARLDHALDTLTAGSRTASPRHHTLRAAIEWSYQLLNDDERALLARAVG